MTCTTKRLIAGTFLAPLLLLPVLATDAHDGGDGRTPTIKVAPAGQHGFPYISSAIDLASRGYTEKEYLISGTAEAYINDGPFQAHGVWNAIPNPGVTAPFTVRLLVRRPTDPARFNGVVLVEWLNVSGSHDIAPDWGWTYQELLREGYAYVGVTTQFLGAKALQDWEHGSKDRYKTIFHPGDSFAYDIFSQAGRAIAHPRAGGPRPLAELTPRIKALLADGESQSANRLITYYNSVHRLARVYDGFLIHSHGNGGSLSFTSAGGGYDPPPGVPATPAINTPHPSEPDYGMRTDLHTPVLFVNSETDVSNVSWGGVTFHRQPDSRTFRLWEIAGSSHFDRYQFVITRRDEEKSDIPSLPSPDAACNGPPINDGPQKFVMRAAVHALSHWVRTGVPPVRAPRISLEVDEDFVVTLNRDEATGLIIGGIRLPQVSVPTATHSGERADPDAQGPHPGCVLWGTSDSWNRDSDAWDGQEGLEVSPTPEPDVQVLYGSHREYFGRVAAATLRSVTQGFLRPRDAISVLKEAAASRRL